MRAISLRLPGDLLDESGRCAAALDLSRAEYIRQALREMNQRSLARLSARRLSEASHRVREEGMVVLAEFEAVEGDPSA